MPRQAGSKVVPCPKPRCKGKIVTLLGKTGMCKHCGTEVKVTKKYLAELGK